MFFQRETLMEIGLRVIFFIGIVLTRSVVPFIKSVQINEWQRYNFPRSAYSRVPEKMLFTFVFLGYFIMVILLAIRRRFIGEISTGTANNSNLDGISLKRHFSKSDEIEQIKLSTKSSQGTIKNACLWQKHLFFSWSLAIMLTMLTTDISKNFIGRPRPDFLSRCQVENFDPEHPNFESLGRIPLCTSTDVSGLNDGRRSFPSGHASLSYATSVFLALFVYNACANTILEKVTAFRFILSYLCIVPAIYCGLSRYMDYMHHWEDIFCGAIIGTLFSTICFFAYYPPSSAKLVECPKNKKNFGEKASSADQYSNRECLLSRNEVNKQRQMPEGYKNGVFVESAEATQDLESGV